MEINVKEYKNMVKSLAQADAALDYMEVMTKKDIVSREDVIMALILGGRNVEDLLEEGK